jgi:uncharacterized protein YoxC
MLAFLGSKIGAYMIAAIVIILVVIGVILHLRAESQTIIKLDQQVTLLQVETKNLEAANDAMRADINNVQQAQRTADQTLSAVRDQADSAVKLVRTRTFTTRNPSALQAQLNKETREFFAHVQAVSRGQ